MLSAIDATTTPITVASLLDHMDWMTDRMINEEITHLMRKMDPVRGRIFWRSFADDVHAAPLFWLNPEKVPDDDDRVGMYWSTWISHLKNVKVHYEERIDTKQDKGLLANLITGAKMVTFPFWKPLVASTLQVSGHAKDMESFYKYQKEGYDAFREGLLHARPALMEAFPLAKGKKMIWVDIGGGTARNLEFFPVDLIKKHFQAIYVVDISASLLEMAQQRIDRLGLGGIAKVIEHDVTAPSLLKQIPDCGKVDIVTMSYSYTMIPNQKATLQNISKLLTTGGHVAIADFFLHGKYDDCLSPLFRKIRNVEAFLHKTWFAFDHVHLLSEDQIDIVKDDFQPIWDNRFRGAIPFMPFFQPYHGVYIMRKK